MDVNVQYYKPHQGTLQFNILVDYMLHAIITLSNTTSYDKFKEFFYVSFSNCHTDLLS